MTMSTADELPWLHDFLDKLRCPNTRESLRLATADEKARLGAAAGAPALINQSGTHLYPVIDGIPHLLPTSALVIG